MMNWCPNCRLPLDSRYFDASGVAAVPEPGRQVTLARFELPPQYEGVLEYFSQYTDRKDASQIETPGIEWLILSNRQPLDPYLSLEHIVNPWGIGGFPIALRVGGGTVLEFAVRRRAGATIDGNLTKVGGRLVGRYWYNTDYSATAGRNGR